MRPAFSLPMPRPFPTLVGVVLALLGLTVGRVDAENWPGWRGPRGDGTSLDTSVPTRWSATENLVWKTAIPGEGHSSPVLWNDRIFLTTALTESRERVLLALDRDKGTELWRRTVVESPLEAKNNENSYASATPATDGQRVYVSFLDGMDVVVAAFDFAGKQRWLARPGRFKSQWGFSHSPLLFRDRVLLACYSKGENFVVALDAASGEVAWKTPASNPTQSYSQPLIREILGQMQMIVPGNKGVTSYDPVTGRVRWYVEGLADDSVITPVYDPKSGLVLSCTSWPTKQLVAIRPDGDGEVTATKIVWRSTDGAPYVPSPIAAGDWFFTSSFGGRSAYCFEVATGQVLWKEPMGLHHASPVSANGLIYFLNDDGVAHVVKAGPKYELVARNELGEPVYASPAISEGRLYLRGFRNLYCFGRR